MARIRGPANHDAVVRPGVQTRVEVPEGSYTVALEGFTSDRVTVFGESSNVTVRAGTDTHVALQLADFVPVLSKPAPARVGQIVVVEWQPVTGAAFYAIELSEDFTNGVDSVITASAPLWQPVFGNPRRFLARVHAVSTYGSAGGASSEELIQVGVPLRLHVSTTSDWTVVLPGGGMQWAAPTIVSTSSAADFAFDSESEAITLMQPIDRAEVGSNVEGIVDLLADADCGEGDVRVSIERGHIGSTRIEFFRDLGAGWAAVASLIWDGVRDVNDDPRNTSNFEIPCDLLLSEPESS